LHVESVTSVPLIALSQGRSKPPDTPPWKLTDSGTWYSTQNGIRQADARWVRNEYV